MASIEPYNFREKTNLQEHNDIITKVNEIVDVINDTDLENIATRLTNDESQIAVNTAGIKANTTAIANLKESERRLSNDVVSTYTLYRNGEGKIKAQMETVGGTLIDSNTLDMIIPYQYDIISGTTDRSFKLNITMSDGSSYTTNDFVIPDGGGSEIVVTGITLSKDSTNVNRFHVGINLSDSTMIDSGYISMVDNVVATYSDSKLTISVNGVSSVPVAIDVSGEFTPGTGITITSGTIAIDDSVVALKSDIADMETKTNASATYATKTALALTDSVANDANEKANDAINNVSLSGSTMTFTKINDGHIDVNIPSLPRITINNGNTISLSFSSYSASGNNEVIPYCFSLSTKVTNIGIVDSMIATYMKWYSGLYGGKFTSTDRDKIAAMLLSNSDLDDGNYFLTYLVSSSEVTNNYYSLSINAIYGKMIVTISDKEIISTVAALNAYNDRDAWTPLNSSSPGTITGKLYLLDLEQI